MLIADKQQAVEEHHERSKFVTRTEDVKAAKVGDSTLCVCIVHCI